MSIPRREEINVYDSLDERVACDHFLGKSLEQAEALFRENSLYFQEDLMWMGPNAFRFYVKSFINHIQNDSATDISDISCFAMILEHRLEIDQAELIAIAPMLAAACGYILVHFDKYAANTVRPELHGDLRSQFKLLVQRLSEIT